MITCEDGFLNWQIVKILNAISDGTTLEINHQYCLTEDCFSDDETPIADGMIVYVVKNMRKIPKTERQWDKMTRTCKAVYLSNNKEWVRIK